LAYGFTAWVSKSWLDCRLFRQICLFFGVNGHLCAKIKLLLNAFPPLLVPAFQ